MKTTLQKLRKGLDDKFVLAQQYYAILSVLNNLGLTQREIQLVAFTAIHGNMSYAFVREDFCKVYGTTMPTIDNMISRLKKIGVLIKEGGKIKVDPRIVLDFDNDVVLQITLHGKAKDIIS